MNILVDVHGLTRQKTGKAMYTETLLNSLRENQELHFTLFASSQTELGFLLPDHWRVKKNNNSGLRFQIAFAQESQNDAYDVIFSPTSFIPALFSHKPLISIIYDLASFQKGYQKNRKAHLLESLLLSKVIARSQAIITISQAMKEELVNKYPSARLKTTAILAGPRSFPQADNSILKKHALQKDAFLLFVGTQEPRKNLTRLLMAYKVFSDQLKGQGKAIPPLVLAGGKGWGENSIEKLMHQLQLTAHLRLLGYVTEAELAALYAACRFLTFVPYYEGFGLPIVEAYSFGKPCITSTTSSLPEVAGPAGLLVDPQDEKDISKAMLELWTNNKEYRQLQVAIPSWMKQFSSEKQAEKFLALLTLLQKHRKTL